MIATLNLDIATSTLKSDQTESKESPTSTEMSNYTVRKLKIGKTEQLDRLARAAGELYSRTVVSFWRTVRHKNIWMKASSMMRWHNSEELHAHSADAVVQNFYASLQSWRTRRKSDPNAKPPRRRRWFYKVTWKSSAIHLKNGKLILSSGKDNEALVVDWHWDKPKIIEMGWHGSQYELRACYPVEVEHQDNQGSVAGVDLGEIHLAVTHDGINTDIFNGRYLRSVRRYQNKLKAKLSSLIDKKQRGSKSRKRLVKSKQRRDGVGSINIRRKYLGDSTPVVGLMASPVGARFHPHLQRSLRLRSEAARIPCF